MNIKKYKKHRIALIATMTIAMCCLTGCTKYEKDTTFSTDLNGTYTWVVGSEEIKYLEKATYTFDNEDYTYEYHKENNDDVTDNSSEGKVLSTEKINKDIDKIVLQDNNNESTIYRYKNMLGQFYSSDIPKGKTFDLIINTPTDSMFDTYPNEAIVFDKDGNVHTCLDYTNCTDTEDDHLGIYYKYVQKNDKIYFLSDAENNYYQILYYVTDDGLFVPSFTKEK